MGLNRRQSSWSPSPDEPTRRRSSASSDANEIGHPDPHQPANIIALSPPLIIEKGPYRPALSARLRRDQGGLGLRGPRAAARPRPALDEVRVRPGTEDAARACRENEVKGAAMAAPRKRTLRNQRTGASGQPEEMAKIGSQAWPRQKPPETLTEWPMPRAARCSGNGAMDAGCTMGVDQDGPPCSPAAKGTDARRAFR